jgi:hypothetical protein
MKSNRKQLPDGFGYKTIEIELIPESKEEKNELNKVIDNPIQFLNIPKEKILYEQDGKLKRISLTAHPTYHIKYVDH